MGITLCDAYLFLIEKAYHERSYIFLFQKSRPLYKNHKIHQPKSKEIHFTFIFLYVIMKLLDSMSFYDILS